MLKLLRRIFSRLNYLFFVGSTDILPEPLSREEEEKYVNLFELQNNINDGISSFSHGMKQKVALIAALAHDPKVLIMDEPFVGLDPKAVFDIKEIMKEMCKEGKTIFFSTHILEVAEKLCSRVAIIKQGKIVKVGSMEEVKGDESLEKFFLELDEENF